MKLGPFEIIFRRRKRRLFLKALDLGVPENYVQVQMSSHALRRLAKEEEYAMFKLPEKDVVMDPYVSVIFWSKTRKRV